MTTDSELLDRLEGYYDAVPRGRAHTEECGPFTLFIATTGWPYYARPRLGGTDAATPDDVRRAFARQRELGVAEAMEWVDEISPGLLATVRSLEIKVDECPLLVLNGPPRGGPGTARLLDPDKPADVADLAVSRAAIHVAFDHEGTATGSAGIEARDAAESGQYADTVLEGMRAGRIRQAAVYDAEVSEVGPVGGGGYSPVDGVAEIAGVGVLPAYRRRGLAAQLTFTLATDALANGLTTVFCSAESEAVARVYEGVGFRRVGTACIADVATSS